jgi:hypothetical protein
MSASTDAYRIDDYTTLELATDGGVTTTPIAGIMGVTIIPSVSIDRLYTADSGKIEEQSQYEYAVDVGIEYALWDAEASVVQQWLGGDGASSSSWSDESQPQKFQISGTFDSVGGDRTLDTTVTGITFEEMPIIDGEMNEYLSRDLSGTGEDITDLSMTDNVA